jgi:hypothetical protein
MIVMQIVEMKPSITNQRRIKGLMFVSIWRDGERQSLAEALDIVTTKLGQLKKQILEKNLWRFKSLICDYDDRSFGRVGEEGSDYTYSHPYYR